VQVDEQAFPADQLLGLDGTEVIEPQPVLRPGGDLRRPRLRVRAVEAFDSAMRRDREGLYRSRWGNYDLVLTNGLLTPSEGLVGADLPASRLQGQDVCRSAFYAVVRNRLGWSREGADPCLPGEIQSNLA
jgi:hypothetical protein